MAPPTEIDWGALSPASREIVKLVVMRIVAGYTLDEIVTILQGETEKFRYNTVPPRGVSRSWLTYSLRRLRAEIAANDPSYERPKRGRPPKVTVAAD